MSQFISPDKSLYFSKKDPLDPRLGEVFQFTPQPRAESSLCLLGYPDDEGISLNGGRPGAAQGPDSIRKWLFKMTSPFSSIQLDDLGNLNMSSSLALKDRHEESSKKLQSVFTERSHALTLGGGHDYGYPDGKAFLKSFGHLKEKPLIINFDAHLDVRDLQFGLTSGTPFFRLKTEFPDFEMVQVGIQRQCNSQKHLQWCKDHGIEVLFLDDFFGQSDSLKEIFERKWIHHASLSRPTFISLDIDGFSSSFAPGCSQSWPTGFEPREFFPLFNWILKNFDTRLLSLYEVSPPLDTQSITSKLAAQIAFRFIEEKCFPK